MMITAHWNADMSDDKDFIMKVSSSECSQAPSGAGAVNGRTMRGRVPLKIDDFTRRCIQEYFKQKDPSALHIIQGSWALTKGSYHTHGFDS